MTDRFSARNPFLYSLITFTMQSSTTQATNDCRLLLPQVIPAVVGTEIKLYFDNVVLAQFAAIRVTSPYSTFCPPCPTIAATPSPAPCIRVTSLLFTCFLFLQSVHTHRLVPASPLQAR